MIRSNIPPFSYFRQVKQQSQLELEAISQCTVYIFLGTVGSMKSGLTSYRLNQGTPTLR